MHLFLQFNGRFTPKADIIARRLATRGFTRFSGISTGEGHARWLRNPRNTPIPYHHVQPLPELWRRALDRGRADNARLADLEKIHGNLWRFVIGDRNLGHTFLTGTIVPETLMRRRNRSADPVFSCLQELFDYFERRFTDDRPDFVFFQVVASAPALVAAAVCRSLKIPFFTLGKTKLDDRHHIAANAFMVPDAIIERYADPSLEIAPETHAQAARLSTAPERYDHFAADLEGYARRHSGSWFRLAREQLTALPAALQPWTKPYPPDPRSPTPVEQWLWETRVRVNFRRVLRAGVFTRDIPDGNFVYFALSVTPEASTCVEAPHYADQLVVIGALAQALPAGWRLVVKDHVPMCGRRTLAFYRQAAQYPNTVLVDPTLSSIQLSARAGLTAVIAGTAGWEAMLLGKPVIAFANAWFLATGLAKHCRNLTDAHADIQAALDLALSTPPAERARRLARMLQAMKDRSFPFPYDLMWNSLTPESKPAAIPLLEQAADRAWERFQECRASGAVLDPFDTSRWTRDRTPPAATP